MQLMVSPKEASDPVEAGKAAFVVASKEYEVSIVPWLR